MDEVNDELKEIDIKDRICYYFEDRIKFEDFDLDNILIDEKSWKIILVHNISYKTLIGARHLRIWFDKIDGFTTVYDGSRYLVLFVGEKNDSIYNGVRYPIGVEYLIILIKTVFNKDKNNYY